MDKNTESKVSHIMYHLDEQMQACIEELLSLGVRNVNIEIELLQMIRKHVYPERQHKS